MSKEQIEKAITRVVNQKKREGKKESLVGKGVRKAEIDASRQKTAYPHIDAIIDQYLIRERQKKARLQAMNA